MNTPSIPESCRDHSAMRTLLGLSAILLLFLLFALRGIGEHDIIKDELTTSQVIRMPVGPMVEDRLANGHPPLYFLFMRAWVGLWGHTHLTLLWSSIFVAALGIPVFWTLARSLGLGRWAWGATLLLAVHPSYIYFARYVRAQIGILVIICVALLVLKLAIEKRQRQWSFALLTVGLVSAAWNHLGIWFWVALLVGMLVSAPLRRRSPIEVWFAVIGALAAHGLWLWACSRAAGRHDPLAWIEAVTLWRDYIQIPLRTLGGTEVDVKDFEYLMILPLLLLGLALWAGVALIARKGQVGRVEIPETDHAAWQAVAWTALLPPVIMIVSSLTWQPMMVFRYFVLLVPGFLLLSIFALHRLTPRKAGIGLLVILLALALIHTRKESRPRDSGLRRSVRILERLFPRDGSAALMVFNEPTREALALYSPDRKYKTFKVWRRLPIEEQYRDFENGTRHHDHFWVIAFSHGGGILSDPDWPYRSGLQYVHERNEDCLVQAYYKPRNIAPEDQGLLRLIDGCLRRSRNLKNWFQKQVKRADRDS